MCVMMAKAFVLHAIRIGANGGFCSGSPVCLIKQCIFREFSVLFFHFWISFHKLLVIKLFGNFKSIWIAVL